MKTQEERVQIERERARKHHKRDVSRRKLVGARMPRPIADMVTRAAEKKGVSVYRWVYDLVVKELFWHDQG